MQVSTAMIHGVAANAPLVDLLCGAARWQVSVHELGFVALVDLLPRLVPEGQTADGAIVQAARVSHGAGTKQVSEDEDLIRYLLRHRHTSPFEMVEMKFHCKMPIFVARQWVRHRMASINEVSGRYSVVKDEFFRPHPDSLRQQSQHNKQGGTEALEQATADEFHAYLRSSEAAYEDYEHLIRKGVARELARIGLPLSLYTEWYWKIDLHNLFHFLCLRLEAHAQQEMRDYAAAILELITPFVPVAVQAFKDYRLEALTLSRLEMESLRSGQGLATNNKREQAEWQGKRTRLGLECR